MNGRARDAIIVLVAVVAATACEQPPPAYGNVVVTVRDDVAGLPGHEDGGAWLSAVILPGAWPEPFASSGRCNLVPRPSVAQDLDAGEIVLTVRDTEVVLEHNGLYYLATEFDRTLIDVDEPIDVRTTGALIPKFQASVHVPAPLEGVTLPESQGTVSRAEPLVVTWTPIETDGRETVVALGLGNVRAGVTCYAEPGDDRFEVPVELLAELADDHTGINLMRYRVIDVGVPDSEIVFRGGSLVGRSFYFEP
jgi:hypothetical protein